MQNVLLRAAGLYTFPNNLSEVPQGALTTADNVVIDKNGIIESRRGLKQYGNTFGLGTDRASQLLVYKNRLLRHFQSTLQYDDGTGNFSSFSGTFAETETGLRIKSIEANGNLYFTTSAGIYRISASDASQFVTSAGYIRTAGGVQALDLNGTVDYSTGGWFTYQTDIPGQTKVAYRMTWAFNDANGNLIEGAPSSRLVLTNYSTTSSANVDLTFQIPSAIGTTDTQFFYRIYRTAVVQTSVGVTLDLLDPGDEQYLVIQDYPSSAQLSSRTVTVTDVTPESFRKNGSLLYTNPVSGEGILQSNYPPPIAKDINLFQSTAFYANTQTIQQLNLSLLSTENLISGTSTVTVTDGTTSNTYTFIGKPEITKFTFDTKANTADGSYFLINAASDQRKYFVWFNKSGAKESTTFTFADTVSASNDGGYFLLNSADDVNKYFIWFDKTGSTPAPSGSDTLGRIGIRVSLIGLSSANDVANAVANVIPTSDFTTSYSGGHTVNVTNLTYGATTNAAAGSTPPGPTFSLSVVVNGSDPTPQPTGADTVGRLPILVDLTQAVSATDVAQAVANALNAVTDFSAFNSTYTFTVSAASATVGAIYTNSDQDFVVTTTISGGTSLSTLGLNSPAASGTLTKANTGGTGNTTITYSAFVTSLSANVAVVNTDNGKATDAAIGLVAPGGAFALSVLQQGDGEDTSLQHVLLGNSLSTSISIDETARSLVKNINDNSGEIVNAYYVSGPTDLPGLILLQARSLSQPAFHMIANSTATGNEFSPALPTSGSSVSSSNLIEPNAIYYSKFQQPEAVPTVNKFLVGPKDKAIVRILPIRTGLMILKEDGIYRLTGTNGQFNIDPFDNSAIILAADSATVLNNQIYMFSTQGVVTLTDTGVNVISRPIEDKLTQIITPGYDYKTNTFGVAYESDRAYLLWTVTSTTDTQPTQCFRFNTFTTAWTRWPISKTCGIVKFDEQRLYLGAGDENFIEQERKSIDRTDYADREFDLQIPSDSVLSSNEVVLSSTSDVIPGDVLVQTQYLTIYQFNQLLMMLDSDPGTGYKNYFSTLQAPVGAHLRDYLDNLALKLDTDPGLLETDFYSSLSHGPDFTDFQADFNVIINKLNTNSHTVFTNYQLSSGTVIFDMVIESTVQFTNNVIVQYLVPIIEGPVILSKGITTEVIWAPQTFGDPTIAKHVNEGTFLFNDTVFNSATISYASDLMPNFEEVVFDETGIGDWGGFVWDQQYWGGTGSNVPLRTYIPRNQQYCRFIRPRFVHTISREKFELLGTSLTFRPISERAYRS